MPSQPELDQAAHIFIQGRVLPHQLREMRLYKLIGLELEALINEHEETMQIFTAMKTYWIAEIPWRRSL